MTNAIEELRKEVARSDGGQWTYETEHIEVLLAEVERLREELAESNAQADTARLQVRRYADALERLRADISGDGLLTLREQIEHAREEIARLQEKHEDMTSIALWTARRLRFDQHKDFAYDGIERNLGREVERV